MTALAETVANQGAVLRHALELDLEAATAKLAGAERVWLVGTGTSEHAALLGAAMLTTAGLDARAVSGQGFVVAPPRLGPDDAVIVISHTATTTFARQAREEALAAGARVISITGEGKGWPEAIEAAPPERSETYTASYLAALLVLARLAAELAGREPAPRLAVRATSATAARPRPPPSSVGSPGVRPRPHSTQSRSPPSRPWSKLRPPNRP